MKYLLIIILSFSQSVFAAVEVLESRSEVKSKTSFREERILGLGAIVGGALGVAGLKMDIGLFQQDSIAIGFGGGDPFLSVSIEYKRILFGKTLMPYFFGGFSRWQSSGSQSLVKTNPEYLGEELISDEDREKGVVSENLFYPGLGLQFYQPDGALKGSSILLEIMLLSDLEDFDFVPTGSFSYLYYF